jgi:hypothetical protein
MCLGRSGKGRGPAGGRAESLGRAREPEGGRMGSLAGEVLWLHESLPSFKGGFNSRRPLVVPRGVAQSGSAPGWGPGGRRFKSCLPDHAKWLGIG